MPRTRNRLFGATTALALLAVTGLAQLPTASADVATARYIVRTASAVGTDHAVGRVEKARMRVGAQYDKVFHGFAAQLTATQVQALRADPAVVSVAPDRVIRISSEQTTPTWGLDRIDQHARPLSHSYSYQTTGAGVTVFELDTGIRFSHEQFDGRASSGYDFSDGDADASDCNGHGTHVAGTIGGRTYGVAKDVSLVALRVLDCEGNGSESDFESALEWVIEHKPAGPSVVNISAGGSADADFDAAVDAVTKAGVPVVVAAGNDTENACLDSPARVPAAITVGASTETDSRAEFSNYGTCVDLFAPGTDVVSASNASAVATETMSGTSMATPHVTGAVARYLQAYPKAKPAAVTTALVGEATKGEITHTSGSPDRLLYLRRSTTTKPRSAATTHSSSKRTLKLSWKAPYGFGAPAITGYRITRSGTDTSGKAFASTVLSASSTSYTFTKLKRSKAYTVTVSALNAAGASPKATKSIKKL